MRREGRASLTLRTRAVGTSKSETARVTLRSDVMVLCLAAIAGAGTYAHNHAHLVGPGFGLLADGIPIAVYLGLALAGFVPRLRSAASWALLVVAWIMVIMALVGVIPRTVMISASDGFSTHVVAHCVVLAAQVPLIIMLIRRLNGTACRWTAPTPSRR